MLTRLKIENIAIIESADITLESGFNVLTGETGAGKSIIIDSINAVTGERTSKELVRTGAPSARVSAVFENTGRRVREKLESMGFENDGTLVLSRVIKKDGKNVCTVNGEPVNVGTLKDIGSLLINIHGQHDSQSLLQSEMHCSFIDEFGSLEGLIDEYKSAYSLYCEKSAALKNCSMDEQQKARETDILSFQIDEIEKAGIRVGEADELRERRDFLRNAKSISDALSSAYSFLASDRAGCDCVNDASYELESAAALYDGVQKLSDRINDVKYELQDCCDEIRDMISLTQSDPRELEEIEDRLDLIHRLSLKYGSDENAMLLFLENAKKRLEAITFSDEMMKKLGEEKNAAFEKARGLSQKLTQARMTAGKLLSKKICSELEFLDMPSVRFEVKREEKALCEDGADEIEFLISANLGEEPKPLSKIASGGELSRIMLAIKNSLSQKDGVDTMIFDEIDTGVSGSAAKKIGEKLCSLSDGKQVICVTHLAQIACFADCHMLISKHGENGKTYTDVDTLDFDGRTREIARIMGADSDNSAFLASAAELLNSCSGSK